MDEWIFKDSPNTAVISTKKIIHNQAPIKLVTHDKEDGGWQFLDGSENQNSDGAAVVGLQEIINLDPTILELADLPLGWRAWRENKESKWQKAEIV